MTVFLPDFIQMVLDSLHHAGYEAYIVGGCVRDMLMGKTPHDYDVTTAALPETVQALFPRTVATGLRHGTVTVLADGHPVEVTTFRTEDGYADHRRPEKVTFVSTLKEDLSRRDFTVNAMAYSKESGLVDPFDGRNDLAKRILRAVGDPVTRFEEDALRILRLFRFAAVLGFTCDADTQAAALQKAAGLQVISRERVTEELKKAVMGDVSRLSPLLQSGALAFLGLRDGDFSYFDRLPGDRNLRLFAFLRETAVENEFGTELKLSNTEKEFIRHLTELCKLEYSSDRRQIKRFLRDHGDYVLDYGNYRTARFGDGKNLLETVADIQKNNEPYRIQDLCITGHDLTERGILGIAVGETLHRLLEAVIDDPHLNTRETLLSKLNP